MKKYGLILALSSLIAMPVFTSCSDDPEPDKVTDPVAEPSDTSEGVFILTQGNSYSQVPGSLSQIDYSNLTVTRDLFQKVNDRSLGTTPQCGLVYGSRIYLGIYESSTIEIARRSDMKSEKQIKCDGAATGTQPRAMVADGGYVYISMYDGNVARLDTTTLSIDKVLKVGPNPETPAIFNGKMFVPNSDGMNYTVGYGTTASIIDLASFSVEATVEVPLNPNQFLVAGSRLFLLSKGDYGMIESALYEIDPDIVNIQKKNEESKGWRKIARATLVAAGNGYIYMSDTPFSEEGIVINYSRYDVAKGEIAEWKPSDIIYPSAIAVDPVSGRIVVTSYIMNGTWPSYEADGYANLYSPEGIFEKKFEIGAGTPAIFFNTDK